MKKQTEFFADADDLRGLLTEVASLGDFRYTQVTSAPNSELVELRDPDDVLRSAMVRPDAPHRGIGYVVTDAGTTLTTRKIQMADGSGYKATIDEAASPSLMGFAAGGDAGDRTLINSVIGVGTEAGRSHEIYALFRKVIARSSERIGVFLVMPGALRKLDGGWRLTGGKGFHPGLDLKRP